MKKKSISAKVKDATQDGFTVAPVLVSSISVEPQLTVSGPERLDTLPDACPRCGRKNSVRTATPGATGLGWHYYRFIPSAPAAGCGACGHIIYITEQVYEQIRREAHLDYPKAAAGKITKRTH